MAFQNDFEKWKYYFDQGWASEEQLKMVVSFGKISVFEYEEITGKSYEQ